MNRRKVGLTAAAAVGSALLLMGASGCDEAVQADKAVTDEQMKQYQQSQPVPGFAWSQERATLIALLTARATTTATTAFFFNQGVQEPFQSCPSLGMPLATTAQLTNPGQVVSSGGAVVDQAEPTGIYTGESTGTYVVCVDSKGQAYPVYWEGFVLAVGGPAEWRDGKVVLLGDPTVKVESK